MLFLQHRGICLIGFAICQAAGQTFDAASLKPFDPARMRSLAPEERRAMTIMSGGPGSKDPGRLHYPGVTLQMLLLQAYDVTKFQLQGPDWLAEGALRFNIDATLPPDTPMPQFRAMLRNLIVERFHLTAHSEKKEVSGYSLIVGKGKLKIKESAGSAAPANDGEPAQLKLGNNGYFVPPDRQGVFFQLVGTGAARSTFRQVTMQELAATLQNQLKAPVTDSTGLTAKYDFVLSYSTEALDFGGGRLPVGPGAGADPPPDLPTALQEQLGLKLESKKIAADVIVIDHIEKVPTGN